MKAALRTLLASSLPLLSLTVEAFGQVSSPPAYHKWEGTAFGGGSFAGKFKVPSATSGSVGLNYGGGYQVGLQARQNLGDYWAADLEYSFSNQPLTLTNLRPDIESFAVSHSIHQFSYSYSHQPLSHHRRFRPYGRIGAGASLFYIHGSSKHDTADLGVPLRDSWKFTVNLGGGARYMVHDDVALTLDMRDHISGVPSYGLPPPPRVVNGQPVPGSERAGLMHNIRLNFGVTIRWDNW
jgi:opacity protein-like surface antigen